MLFGEMRVTEEEGIKLPGGGSNTERFVRYVGEVEVTVIEGGIRRGGVEDCICPGVSTSEKLRDGVIIIARYEFHGVRPGGTQKTEGVWGCQVAQENQVAAIGSQGLLYGAVQMIKLIVSV